MSTKHRTLLEFNEELRDGASIKLALKLGEKDYVAVTGDGGNRLIVAVRTNSPMFIVNYEYCGTIGGDYIHEPYRPREDGVVNLRINLGDWTFAVEGMEAERVQCELPFDVATLRFVEGSGDWTRIEVHYA